MKPEKIKDSCSNLRAWIEQQRAKSLRSLKTAPFDQWLEELQAVESQLKEKHEIPIAFLGPSQQGKSSLINAILGEAILAVGGAIGACTCVVTSIHYANQEGYRAEIDFISLDEWAKELQEMQSTLLAEGEAGEDRDQLEWDETQRAIREKLKAVYNDEPSLVIDSVLANTDLGLPKAIAATMRSGEPITIHENKAQTLKNSVRKYLVGRDQYPDAQYWPLIKGVRIYGPFEVLSNGLVLVDLPGLNDPNPAREQVTNKYLAEARYLWLICNSQSGIDRVFTSILRDSELLFRLFLEGRLDAFSVVATKLDETNVDAVMQQMGQDPEDFDGDYDPILNFRRDEIRRYIQEHLVSIASEIARRAGEKTHQEAFMRRVKAVQVFATATSAYMQKIGKMKTYGGPKLSEAQTQIPQLIDHMKKISLKESYKAQVLAAERRVQILYHKVRSFFSERIRRLDAETSESEQQWVHFSSIAEEALGFAEERMKEIRWKFDDLLKQYCSQFQLQLEGLEQRAKIELRKVFNQWEDIHHMSLRSTVDRFGEWHIRSRNKDIDMNQDVADAFLHLLPFVWEEFFGTQLSQLIESVASDTEANLQMTVASMKGSLQMLTHRPPAMYESLETTVQTAAESFDLQSSKVRSDLTASVRRTRQELSQGLVATVASSMTPAYIAAQNVEGGTGVKRRILDVLSTRTLQIASELYINLQKELRDGVDVLQASMKPQLSSIVGYGEKLVEQIRTNLGTQEVINPEERLQLQRAIENLHAI